MTHRVHTYEGQQIDVMYDAGRCIHAAECVGRLREVFDGQKKPWIQPDNGTADGIAATIQHCPSGALHYARKDGGTAEPIPAHNTIQLDEDGPLYVKGDITIINGEEQLVLNDTRVALCRCGESKNKPFCDNSHIEAHFEASGTVLQPQTEITAMGGGKLEVKTTTNGSLRITGNITILNDAGEIVFQGDKQWFCRCGHSSNKPFCDGTHKKIGFVAG